MQPTPSHGRSFSFPVLSETLVVVKNTRCDIPENDSLCVQCRENHMSRGERIVKNVAWFDVLSGQFVWEIHEMR